MTADQVSDLNRALITLSIARDDLRRVEDYARRMIREGRGDDQIAKALQTELVSVKRTINAVQISAHSILMAQDQLPLLLQ
jgi:hypothetical protein